MKSRHPIFLSIVTLTLVSHTHAADPWADSVYNYSPGALQTISSGSGSSSTFNNPALAIGAPSTLASQTSGSTDVVQLGQGGSLTLQFNEPILNNIVDPANTTNPLGIDFTVFGNAFEQGFEGSGLYFREPGFVEVSQKQSNGAPGTWYLILPDKLPSALVGGTDSGPGSGLLNYYADEHPVRGTGNALLPPDDVNSAGGDAFVLERAVLESAPGVPQLDGSSQPIYVSLTSVDFVRITDAILNDFSPVLGLYTTDIDAVADLPGTVPEPTSMGVFFASALILIQRRKR